MVLESKFGSPRIVNDGVTVAKEVELQDPIENVGAKLVRQVRGCILDLALAQMRLGICSRALQQASRTEAKLLPCGSEVKIADAEGIYIIDPVSISRLTGMAGQMAFACFNTAAGAKRRCSPSLCSSPAPRTLAATVIDHLPVSAS